MYPFQDPTFGFFFLLLYLFHFFTLKTAHVVAASFTVAAAAMDTIASAIVHPD